ncbi:MAG: hypothetical protein KF773_00150 [Deltaproteobacteria bacterium]|nr:hypothetical protein [Deltaproteobacteria bacterium]
MKLPLLALALCAACYGSEKNPISCFDRICKNPAQYCDFDGSVAGTPGLCLDIECTPGQFETCRADDTSAVCNAAGDNLEVQTCDLGCDPATGCNTCTPNTVTCDGDILRTCNAAGALANETCTAGCISSPTPHCAHIIPRYLPDVCDTPAPSPELVISSSGTFDTSLDLNCNGGIVQQVGGPEICVVRYGSITFAAGTELRVIGRDVNGGSSGGRPIAFVADRDVVVAGVLDIAGRSTGTLDPPPTSGPGGGFTNSGGGQATSGGSGGGGAGFKTAGAPGGTATVDGGGMNGGAPRIDPITSAILEGGPRNSGGGGGAMTLVACQGSVRVPGLIDAGGGGGLGGFPSPLSGNPIPGGGGGAGGYVVLQGLSVDVTGEVYANGGGGGGGRIPNSTFGAAGKDGQRSEAAAAGGNANMAEGAGGSGGCITTQPGGGKHPSAAGTTPGGGGGSMGFFQSYTPTIEAATLEPLKSSPRFQPPAMIPTR